MNFYDETETEFGARLPCRGCYVPPPLEARPKGGWIAIALIFWGFVIWALWP